MALSDYINTFGQYLLRRYGQRVHKLAINAGLSCPNRDGTQGRGGCTFCNNASFNPSSRRPPPIAEQMGAGRGVIARRTGARRYFAYFQAYTNTYAELEELSRLYEQALDQPGVVGLSVGTRPDCLSEPLLALLAGYRHRGFEVWVELGLQSASDLTLARVNRGHGFAEYREAVEALKAYGLPLCTHLIIGLPGGRGSAALDSLQKVLDLGAQGLKLHPLHVVKGTQLANEWRRGEYMPLAMDEYVDIAADMIERTPADVIFHRVTATAPANLLLAPQWCSKKWTVLNAIEAELARRNAFQGSALPCSSVTVVKNTAPYATASFPETQFAGATPVTFANPLHELRREMRVD